MLEDDDEAVLAPSLRPPLHDSSAPRDREPALVDADAARVRAFLEERAAARLQGEYASAVSHLAELVRAA
jgi:outer membrane protein insertion porin family